MTTASMTTPHALSSEVSRPSTASAHLPWAALILIGAIGGILSGLFAIGGAILMVPLLVWRAGMDQRRPRPPRWWRSSPPQSSVRRRTWSTPTSTSSPQRLISAGAIVGAIIGSRLLRRLPLEWLRWFFIAFLLLIAAHMLIAVPEPGHALALSPLVVIGYLGLGVLTGVASGLFGIGGAIISVPLLGSVFAMSAVIAKGTALLVSIPTSLAGTISNRRGNNPVDVRAGLILGVTAAATSVPAVYLAVALPPTVSAMTFAVLLTAIAIQLIVKAVHTRHAD